MRPILRLAVVLVALCAPLNAFAQSSSAPAAKSRSGSSLQMISAVEGLTSTVMQRGQSSFSGLGLRLNLRPPGTVENFELLPYVEYWRSKASFEGFDIEATRRDATLGMDARWMWRNGGWSPYVGAGFGLHFLSTRVDAPSLGLDEASDSYVKGALGALGGVSFPLGGRFENFLELKYHALSDADQFKINWGLTWGL